MLDLQPGVHLHEVEAAVRMGDELDRAGADVADRLRRLHRRLAHRRAALGGHARRRRLLEHLLVAALHRAVALEQVDAGAEAVGEHLDLDVPRLQHVLLDQHPVVAERVLRLALARGERGGELAGGVDPAHALAAAAGGGLDQHRVADPRRFLRQQRRVLVVAVIAGRERHAGLLHQRLGRRLRAHRPDRRRRRADEDDALAWRRPRRRPRSPRGSRSPDGPPGRRSPWRRRGSARRPGRLARRRRADVHRFVGEADVRAVASASE